LKPVFFILSALGAEAGPKALDGADLPIKGNTYVSVAISGVVCNIRSGEGCTCPGVALADFDDGSTLIEGTSCLFIASSPTTSLTLHFDSLGLGELALRIQEKSRNQSKATNKSTHMFRKSTYLGVSSSSSPGEALTLCFWAVTLCLLE
jgi:hypothetical protein